MRTDHIDFVLINTYAPYSPMEDVDRYLYKLNFHRVLTKCVMKLRSEGRCVLLAGDLNVSAYAIDHCSPSDYVYTSNGTSTTVRFEDKPHVQWLRQLIEGHGMIDTFRHCHPTVCLCLNFCICSCGC